MSFNKVIVVGNLGRDPELRYTPQGTPVCSFSVASNERRKGSDGEFQDLTTWFRVSAWGKQAETVSKYLTKGRSVYVEGRLRVEEWTDKDGKSRYTLELHATDVQFIDGAGGGQGGGGRDYDRGGGGGRDAGRGGGGGGSPADEPVDDDSIPF
ncbi:MAG TPA: single-stranded DNA-binding protein [Pyrinomonadaceae bacterium]|nr:single-stranded DNA-binding protein [Pyrinomonadaceae bacterium]